MDTIAEFGRVFFGALYDYRIPVALGSVVAVIVLAVVAWRRGWIAAARRHPGRSGIALALALAIGLPLTWYMASPLVLRNELIEPEPVAVTATSTPGLVTVTPSPAGPASAAPSATPEATASPSSEPASGSDAPAATQQPTTTPKPAATAKPTATPKPAATPFQPVTIARGEFYGSDEFHFGSGTASIIETAPGRYRLRLADFSVRNGPDLFVYLSPDPAGYVDGAVEIGRLKATDGSFGYDLPEGVDPADFRSAIIWCKQFSHLFATAPFE